MNRQVGRRGGGGALGTQHRTSVLFSNFNSHWYCEYAPNGVNVCERDINSAWPFRGQASSDYALPTAAVYSVGK